MPSVPVQRRARPQYLASKNDIFIGRVGVELSPKCRLEEGISSNRALNSNYNVNDLEAIGGVLNSDDYTDDPETLRGM